MIKNISIILGTRPEIIKLSPIIRIFSKKKVNFFIIHTNQHYSEELDKIFFDELGLTYPKYNLKVKSNLHGEMTALMLSKIENILLRELPDLVMVQGDTNSVLAGALAASKINIPIAHVESGLRSFDKTMPEEINRIIVDHLSSYLFVPTKIQKDNLVNEGIDEKKIHVVGNTIVDAIKFTIENMCKPTLNLPQKYFLLTLHRPSNVDSREKLNEIISALNQIVLERGVPFIFPIHPRTKKMLELYKIKLNNSNIKIIQPLCFSEMLYLEKNALVVFTDSGGVQEESCVLKTKTITIRHNTERPETVFCNANILAGSSKSSIIKSFNKIYSSKNKWSNPFGNGDTASKIYQTLVDNLKCFQI